MAFLFRWKREESHLCHILPICNIGPCGMMAGLRKYIVKPLAPRRFTKAPFYWYWCEDISRYSPLGVLKVGTGCPKSFGNKTVVFLVVTVSGRRDAEQSMMLGTVLHIKISVALTARCVPFQNHCPQTSGPLCSDPLHSHTTTRSTQSLSEAPRIFWSI